MSTRAEQIEAQRAAWEHEPIQPWHRHLIGPERLRFLFEMEDEMRAMGAEPWGVPLRAGPVGGGTLGSPATGEARQEGPASG